MSSTSDSSTMGVQGEQYLKKLSIKLAPTDLGGRSNAFCNFRIWMSARDKPEERSSG
jgi:hypothetical protein